MTKGLRAVNRWCLSATPPLSSFEDIKTIASVLHVHLGKSAPKTQNEKRSSAAEMFHSYREMHSPHWHKWRNEVAQQFLDRFVRGVRWYSMVFERTCRSMPVCSRISIENITRIAHSYRKNITRKIKHRYVKTLQRSTRSKPRNMP